MTVDEVEKKIQQIYKTAENDISDKWFDFMSTVGTKVNQLQEDMSNETDPKKKAVLQAKYQQKLAYYTAGNKHFKAMSQEISDRLVYSQKQACEWTNGQLPQLYSLTYNETGITFASPMRGYSFELVDQATIKNLAMNEDASLLPIQTVDEDAAKKYYNKVINSQVTQAVVQGESVPKLAARVANVTNASKVAATRTARTAFTSASNKGVIDAQHKAVDDGIILKKKWLCAVWSHNRRDWHADISGDEKDVDEPFVNDYGEIMYPGDPHAHPANVYNCRCRLTTVVKGFKNVQTGESYALDGSVTYNMVNPIKANEPALDGVKFYEEYIGSGMYSAGEMPNAAQYQVSVTKGEIYQISFPDDFANFTITDAEKTAYMAKGIKLLEVVDKDGVVHYVDVGGIMNKTKKGKLDTLPTTLKKWQNKADSVDNKTYSGIWKDDVTVHDYTAKKASIAAKRDYYKNQLLTETDPVKIAKYQQYLIDLDEFETLGKEWEAYNNHVKKIQDEISKLKKQFSRPFAGSGDTYGADAYTQDRKDAALWAKTPKEADKMLRDKCGEVWQNLSQAERDALFEYTMSYSQFNEPLRGYEYGTNRKLGVGNTDLNAGYRNSGKKLNAITSAIDQSTYDFDIWSQRGVGFGGMDDFFGVPLDLLKYGSESDLKNELLGKVCTEYAFMSSGDAKGKGFDFQPIILNIYSPAGTKIMYLEPFSHYGNGVKSANWDGISKQSTFGSEAEILHQQGTQLRVTKVERSNGKLYFDMEVVGQLAPQLWKK